MSTETLRSEYLQCLDGESIDGAVTFTWNGRQFFYSPDHHRIFRQPEIPEVSSRPERQEPAKVQIRSMYLNLSEGCNLRCEYCFSPPSEPGQSLLMSKDTARASIMRLGDWWSDNRTRSPASVTFFGGEPLLNREVISHTLHFAREWEREFAVPFSFAVSTNATLLTEKDIDLFERERVFVWVSIDGPQEIHDRRRRFADGTGSHEVAMENALMVLRRLGSERIGVRATVSAGSEELSEVINYFASQGFRRMATKPVDSNTEEGVSSQQPDVERIAANIDECALAVLQWRSKGVNCFPMDQDINSLKTRRSGRFVCAAGTGSVAVDARGWLYPCHRFVGNPKYCLGHVRGEVDLGPCEEFAALDVRTHPECSRCWARKYCLGCCPGASVATGKAPGHPVPHTCAERKLYAMISLKCAVQEGLVA